MCDTWYMSDFSFTYFMIAYEDSGDCTIKNC
jgi:hypothetical protein